MYDTAWKVGIRLKLLSQIAGAHALRKVFDSAPAVRQHHTLEAAVYEGPWHAHLIYSRAKQSKLRLRTAVASLEALLQMLTKDPERSSGNSVKLITYFDEVHMLIYANRTRKIAQEDRPRTAHDVLRKTMNRFKKYPIFFFRFCVPRRGPRDALPLLGIPPVRWLRPGECESTTTESPQYMTQFGRPL